MNINDLLKEKHKLEQKLIHINALIKLESNELREYKPIKTDISTKPESIYRSEIKGINKKRIIYDACKTIQGEFISADIKGVLEESDNKEIEAISIGYISAQLCKLAQEGKIVIKKRGKGKSNPNIYSNIENFPEDTFCGPLSDLPDFPN